MAAHSLSGWEGFVDFSPDQLSGAASNVPLTVDILSRADAPSKIRQLQSPDGWSLDTSYLNSHVRARGGFQRGCVVVLVATQAADATICNVPLEPGMVLIIPDGQDIFASIKPGAGYTAAVLPTSTWSDIHETATRLSVRAMPSGPSATRLSDRATHFVGNLLAALPHRLGPSDMRSHTWAMPTAISEYLGAIAAASVGSELADRQVDRSLRNRLRQAWMADEFIRENIGDDLPVMRLCKELRLSRRQLEYAFRTAFDLGPAEYILRVRLNESRRRLLSARKTGQSVTEIAMETNVTHLGRFATYYRQLFSETPRQTVRRQ